MTKDTIFKSNAVKFLIPIVLIWGILTIFKGGAAFGDWLYKLLH